MPEFYGWIKIHRKIMDKAFYKKSHYFHLWTHLLLNANHKQNEFLWNNKMILIKEGQLLTGRKELSKETGIAESTIERILDFLENEQQIYQEKTTKFRIITIINWKEYQGEQQTDNRRTTDGQQTDTNKNDKNEKNEEEEESARLLWISIFTNNPGSVEKEFVSERIKFGGLPYAKKLFRDFREMGFHKVRTMKEALDENGNIKPKDSKTEGKTIDYNPA